KVCFESCESGVPFADVSLRCTKAQYQRQRRFNTMSDRCGQPEDETSSVCAGKEAPLLTVPLLFKKSFAYLVPLLLVGALLSPVADGFAQTRGAVLPSRLKGGEPLTRQQVIAQTQPAVVWLLTEDCQGNLKEYSSGEIIDQRGYIVTNDHVVADGQKF